MFQAWQPLFDVPGGALAAGAAVVGFAGLAQVWAASRHRREEMLAAREAISGAKERLAELATRRSDHEAELQALASRLGVADAHELVRSFAEYQRYARECEPLALLEGMRDQIVQSRETVLAETGSASAPNSRSKQRGRVPISSRSASNMRSWSRRRIRFWRAPA
jgi:hypothetical protein